MIACFSQQLGKTLAAELKERRLEQEETDAELAENKEILAKLQLQHKVHCCWGARDTSVH